MSCLSKPRVNNAHRTFPLICAVVPVSVINSTTLLMEAAHKRVCSAASKLRCVRSTLRNAVSSHEVKTPVTFQDLSAFIEAATSEIDGTSTVDASQLYFGSLDGEMLVSARLRAAATPASDGVGATEDSVEPPQKKRKRADSASIRAREAIRTVRSKLVELPAELSENTLLSAETAMENLFRAMRGGRGEELVESCALSFQSSPPASSKDRPRRPPLVIICRFSAGISLSLDDLKTALGPCFADGMLTAHTETLEAAFRLPLTKLSHEVESRGQNGLTLFATVPDEA